MTPPIEFVIPIVIPIPICARLTLLGRCKINHGIASVVGAAAAELVRRGRRLALRTVGSNLILIHHINEKLL